MRHLAHFQNKSYMHHMINTTSISIFNSNAIYSFNLTIRNINSIDDSFISFSTSNNKYCIVAECYNDSITNSKLRNILHDNNTYLNIDNIINIDKDLLIFLFEKRGYYTINITPFDNGISILMYKYSSLITTTNIQYCMLNMNYRSTLSFGSLRKDFYDNESFNYFNRNLLLKEYYEL